MHLAQPIHTTAITPGYEHPRWARIRFLEAAPNADGAGDGAPPAGAGTPPAVPAATPATVAAQQQSKQDSKELWDDPAAAKAEIERLRAENAKDRTNAKATAADAATKALTESIGKALGLIKDGDQAPTAEQLTEQLATATSSAAEAARELAVFKAAASVPGADPTVLLDSRAFLTAVKDIDPTDAASFKAAVEKALTDNPRLKASQAAGKSGGDLTGGTGEGTVTADRFKAMTIAEKNTLYENNPTLYRQLTGR